MLDATEIERMTGKAEPIPNATDKDMVVLLCRNISSIHNDKTLRVAFESALQVAKTLKMDFTGLRDTHQRVLRGNMAETVYPLLNVLFSHYSIKKKVIITVGFLMELAEEQSVCLC